MMQGVLTNGRVRLLLKKGQKCYRQRRTGERKRKSVRGCIVDQNLSILNLVVVKKGKFQKFLNFTWIKVRVKSRDSPTPSFHVWRDQRGLARSESSSTLTKRTMFANMLFVTTRFSKMVSFLFLVFEGKKPALFFTFDCLKCCLKS